MCGRRRMGSLGLGPTRFSWDRIVFISVRFWGNYFELFGNGTKKTLLEGTPKSSQYFTNVSCKILDSYNSVPIRAQFGPNSGTIRTQFGHNSGTIWAQFGYNSGTIRATHIQFGSAIGFPSLDFHAISDVVGWDLFHFSWLSSYWYMVYAPHSELWCGRFSFSMWSVKTSQILERKKDQLPTQCEQKTLLNSGDNSGANSVHAILELDRISDLS